MTSLARTVLVLTMTAGLTVGGLSTPRADAAVSDSTLAAKLGSVHTDSRVRAARSGTLVVDAATGSELYNRNGWMSLAPASNMKLVTAAAALKYLGTGYRYRTEAIARANPARGVVPSALYLKGYGDPTLMDSDLQTLARSIRARGITHFTGDLVADGSFFDAVRYHPGWSSADASRSYAPQVSGLTLAPNTDYDVGTVLVTAYPTRAGRPARITTTPPAAIQHLRIVNKVTTGSSTSVGIYRTAGTNTITVTGRIATAATSGARRWVTVNRPDLLAAMVFRSHLKAAGVTVAGSVIAAATPATSRHLLSTDYSMPLSQIVTPLLKLSNNGMSEHLLKTLGTRTASPGTTANGLAWLRSYLSAAGAPLDGSALHDASGLARANRLTPRLVTKALLYASRQPWFATFKAALPTAGNPSRMIGGTLRTRMVRTTAADHVFAKTGTLRGVTALSGYVSAADGRVYIFSMLSSYSAASPRPVEDRVAITIAAHRR